MLSFLFMVISTEPFSEEIPSKTGQLVVVVNVVCKSYGCLFIKFKVATGAILSGCVVKVVVDTGEQSCPYSQFP